MSNDIQVTVHADAYGNWHANVSESGQSDPKRARKAAYDAILSEITKRHANVTVEAYDIKLIGHWREGDAAVSQYTEIWT